MIIQQTIRIRQLDISPPLLLAPMAGLTHSAMRTLLLFYGGVGLLSTEMLSARRLPSENERVSPFLVKTREERPLSYQLFVSRAADAIRAVDVLHRLGADAIDINLGCPAPRIRSVGGGSCLMEDQAALRAVVAELRANTTLPLTAKIRLGEFLDGPRLRNVCRMLEGEGVDLLTVHARLRGEPFCRRPRWEWIARVKQWLQIPVIANGSIFSAADASRCLAISGADGLMIGRAAPARPWIFADVARAVYGRDIPRPTADLPAIYQRFTRDLQERFRPERRLGRLKEFTHYFATNFQFGHHLAAAVQSSQTFEQARRRAESFLLRHAGETVSGEFDSGSTAAGSHDQRSEGLK
jgi:nifR3 family TIM-barrel protein